MYQCVGQNLSNCGFGILRNINAHPIPAHRPGFAVTPHKGHGILKHAIDGPFKVLVVKKPLSSRTSSSLGSRHNLCFCTHAPAN